MKIASSEIILKGSHLLHKSDQTNESLQTWIGPPPAQENALRGRGNTDRVSISSALSADHHAGTPGGITPLENVAETEISEDPKLRAIRLILEALTGRKIKVSTISPGSPPPPEPSSAPGESGSTAMEGWGMSYEFHERYEEHEEMTFSADGMVTADDGREIKFSIQLNMKRDLLETTDISIRAGDARLIDPLVINLTDAPPQFTDQYFLFDLDGDGQDENIPTLAQGSGYLVWDQNRDNKINNGTELFGPESGNGFSELKQLDSDNNGWLDEKDQLFNELQIWTRDQTGIDYLQTLAERGIGAILLTPVQTEFSLTSLQGSHSGKLRETSVFIRENGTGGTIQEIDLVA